ncbi:MAG: cupin domain-containing protein [Chloroflexi bacterium]|nr:MAG: cupin domain-containing protein [Chloroflexota bacterium]
MTGPKIVTYLQKGEDIPTMSYQASRGSKMGDTFFLGAKLRALRQERELSQRELAKLAGISANAISLIERDEISPSVATLQRLAAALQVKISYFFESDDAEDNVIYVKADTRPALSSRGVSIAGIGRRLAGQQIEPFFITLTPGAESGHQPVAHSGHEFVCCLDGTIEYNIDGNVILLEKGDFLLFEATLPHRWRNPANEPAEFLLILQTPGESDDPIRRHFSNHPSITHLG